MPTKNVAILIGGSFHGECFTLPDPKLVPMTVSPRDGDLVPLSAEEDALLLDSTDSATAAVLASERYRLIGAVGERQIVYGLRGSIEDLEHALLECTTRAADAAADLAAIAEMEDDKL